MSDALNELRRLRGWLTVDRARVINKDLLVSKLESRIAELEAQQAEPSKRPDMTVTVLRGPVSNAVVIDEAAEPSDAEIEAWRSEAMTERAVGGYDHRPPMPWDTFTVTREEVDQAVALMRRGRGDQRLREAATGLAEAMREVFAKMDADSDRFTQSSEDAALEKRVRGHLAAVFTALESRQ